MGRKGKTNQKKSRSWLSGRSGLAGRRQRIGHTDVNMPMPRGSAGPAAQIVAALEQAGYDLTDRGSIERGMSVFMIAQAFARAAQGGEASAGAGARGGPVGGVTPEMIPLLETRAMMEDLVGLGKIFREDPELKRVRFDSKRAAARLAEVERDCPRGENESDAWLDGIAAEFAAEEANRPVLEGLGDRLLEAAPRWRERPADLRRLALGHIIVTMAEADDGPNPITAMLFRLSVGEALEETREESRLLDSLGVDIDRARAALASGEDVLPEDLVGAFSRLPEEDQGKLRDLADRQIDKMREQVLDERFQVHLPIPCVLEPMLAQLELVRRLEDLAPEDERRQGVVEEIKALVGESALGELHREDKRLYAEVCDHWLATESSAHPNQVPFVRTLRQMAATDSIATVQDVLILVSLSRFRFSTVPGEPELDIDSLEADGGELEGYGDFLLQRGYPTLALRFFRASEARRPPSPELANKIAELESHRPPGSG